MDSRVRKSLKKAKEPKVDNPEAVRRMAEERRAAMVRPRSPAHSPNKRSRELEEAFLDGLRDSWSVSKSAAAAGISVPTAYAWKYKSEESLQEDGTYKDDFCVRWEEAMQAGVDRLEDAAIRRAANGVEKPVYQGGVLVGTTTEYSDMLLGLVLRGKRPKTYNTERHEHTGADGKPMEMNMTVTFVKSTQIK
jgi:hypothetical protein